MFKIMIFLYVLLACEDTCFCALVTGNEGSYGIEDSALTASSVWEDYYDYVPENSRLGLIGWYPESDRLNHWIQVNGCGFKKKDGRGRGCISYKSRKGAEMYIA